MNGAITAGFEGDVGNRTSFYVFSTNTMVNALGSYAADGFKHPPRSAVRELAAGCEDEEGRCRGHGTARALFGTSRMGTVPVSPCPLPQETRYVFLPDHDRDYLLLRAALTRQRVDRGRDKGVW